MAFIIGSQKDMLSFVNQALSRLSACQQSTEMIVVPVSAIDAAESVVEMLWGVKCFSPSYKGDDLPQGCVGVFTASKVRTVQESLDELETLSMMNVAELSAMLSCIAHEEEKGKTRRVKVPNFGELIIDLQQYAAATGLPLMSSEDGADYCVFVLEVQLEDSDSKRLFIVAVKGRTEPENCRSSEPTALRALLPRLKARAQSGFDTPASFYTSALDNGWQLLRNPLFSEVLSWMRGGYSHPVFSNEKKGGLDISY